MVQFLLLDALLSNWDAIQLRLGSDSQTIRSGMVAIAEELLVAESSDDIVLQLVD